MKRKAAVDCRGHHASMRPHSDECGKGNRYKLNQDNGLRGRLREVAVGWLCFGDLIGSPCSKSLLRNGLCRASGGWVLLLPHRSRTCCEDRRSYSLSDQHPEPIAHAIGARATAI